MESKKIVFFFFQYFNYYRSSFTSLYLTSDKF